MDFLSVILQNKRIQFESDDITIKQVIFGHNYIVKFLQRHQLVLDLESTIKVFIIERKFKLAIKYLMIIPKSEFRIEYFTMALRSNAFDIAFYLYSKYENEIVQEHNKSISAMLDSYIKSNKFLKAKLQMTLVLMPIFSFSQAKAYLQIV